jgi:gamma-D-glutamyl-L-lysine dipeptidyl-peptidase
MTRFSIIACVCLVVCLSSCMHGKKLAKPVKSPFDYYIQNVASAYAPDQRTVLFRVEANGNMLAGETTSAAAKAALLQQLSGANISFVDSINVLPTTEVQAQRKAVVTISVANLRVKPDHKAELATQATLGSPLTVLKKEKNWYYVQAPDQYLAWVDGEAIARMDSISFSVWQQVPKLLFNKPFGFAYSTAADTSTASDMVYGDVAGITGSTANYYDVVFPDGRKAFINKNDAMPYHDWKQSRQPTATNFVAAAKQLTGLPYLWGGTSFKAVDCSGFTKTVYFMNGLVLPRDASQQVMMGEAVDTTNNWQRLQPGDLLFFGNRENGSHPERVVHVGMWIGNGEFIHASGKVRINSLIQSATNYDAFEHKRFLKVKRISPKAALLDLRSSPLY